ncbi:N-acetyltransferase [Dysgonomonas sp. 216]|uniref:GNAT family N-acetyltransferase n=1 Tax=Dysgonomonas sp. 216 TaxID=2302934 RepID=UPI0013D54A25|nr:GNAT family protein [Dysgonomonas sp. 216]NDW18502.1 N-acetyltransferase [Dysgonomonas sp. 216]
MNEIIRKDYTIRPWQMSDIESLARNANNINIWNNVRDYFPHPYDEEDAKSFIKMASGKNPIQDFSIEVNGKAVGGIGYIPGFDVERINAEIGYWLGEEYWNKGIMGNAIKDMVDYIFENTDIIRLFASVFDFNLASMQVLQKNGFRKLTIFKNAAIKNNKVIDLYYYELLKSK